MATLGSLVLELSANVGRLQTDMQKAVGIVDRGAAGMKRAASLASSALAGLGAGLIGGLSVGALSSVIKSVADYGDHLNDLSKSTGATVEQLSFLDFAAKKSGSSLDGLTSGIARMQKNLIEVSQGGGKQAAAAFNALGISASTLTRTDLVGQLSAIADGLAKIQNPTQRAATAQVLLGKSYRDFLPLLSEGSAGVKELAARFIELGGVVTKAQAEKFDALNDSIVDLQTSSSSVARVITESLAPSLTGFFEGVIKAPTAIGDALARITAQFDIWLSETQAVLAKADIATAEGLKNLIPGTAGDGIFDRRIAEAAARLGAAKAALTAAQDQLGMEQGKGGRGGSTAVLGSGTSLAGLSDSLSVSQQSAVDKLKKSQDDYLDGLRKQIVGQTTITELAKTQADIAADTSGKFDEQTKKDAIALATQIDLLKDAKAAREESAEVEQVMAGYVKERAELEAKATADLIAKKQATIDALMTPLEKYIARVKELVDLGIGGDTLQRGIKAAREEMETAQTKASALQGIAKDLGLTFSSAFEDAVVGASKFSDVLKGLAQDIARLLIRKSVTEPLFNILGGALGSAFGAGGGGGFSDFGALFGNARGGLYKVGGSSSEHPVAFSARAGEVVAVGTGMSGGGGPVINVYEATPGTTAQASPDGRQIDIVVGNSLARNISSNRGAALGLRPALAAR